VLALRRALVVKLREHQYLVSYQCFRQLSATPKTQNTGRRRKHQNTKTQNTDQRVRQKHKNTCVFASVFTKLM
jgi:hypothetical protein